MIRWTYQYFTKLPPIPSAYIDGSLYVAIAVFGSFAAGIGGDEASKFIPAVALFWMRLVVTAIAAGLLALKMFRSTGFADHKTAQAQEEKKP